MSNQCDCGGKYQRVPGRNELVHEPGKHSFLHKVTCFVHRVSRLLDILVPVLLFIFRGLIVSFSLAPVHEHHVLATVAVKVAVEDNLNVT